jgi:hypothetical protein
MKQATYRLFLLPLLFVLGCAGAFAQANSSVTGIVTDQTGAVVSGAKISLTDPATRATKSTISSSTGLYEVAGLNAANYNMKVVANGFETFEQNGIVVNISNTFRVDVKLTIGSETQTVTIGADALAVQGDSNVVSTLINEQQITELPTNGRSVIGLAALGLGVSGNLPDMESPFSVTAEAYDRGSGGKMSVMPSQDALGEFQVLASNYPPDYGIASGGTITMSLKSGTKSFHGEAWEFDRNDALGAHNWADNNNGQNAQTSELRYNVFGASDCPGAAGKEHRGRNGMASFPEGTAFEPRALRPPWTPRSPSRTLQTGCAALPQSYGAESGGSRASADSWTCAFQGRRNERGYPAIQPVAQGRTILFTRGAAADDPCGDGSLRSR